MAFFTSSKNTFLLWFLVMTSCGNSPKANENIRNSVVTEKESLDAPAIVVGANQTSAYLPLLKNKKVGLVANQTSVIFKDNDQHVHLVDSLLALQIDLIKVFAPEHGFRGAVDAGEKVTDGKDAKTGLPLISLYGANRKPTHAQLEDLDVVVFDIQDVGVRFYTFIATLQLVMEACAKNNIPVIVLDRPNPNAHYIDGPMMEKEHAGFLGMTPIPLVYGMTIGEYAQMVNGEGWLTGAKKAALTVIPLLHYSHTSEYTIPIRPSPNLPNDTAINLYPSLGLFEGTNVNAGRGTNFQFQRYGAPFMDATQYDFSYTPTPQFGAQNPKHKEVLCYGRDLSNTPKMNKVDLQWLIDAYNNTASKDQFFLTEGFTKHAGTATLQQQIINGLSAEEIRETWQKDIADFKAIRARYLIYD
ncbi:DUF1343 domain-containing protein [Arenibacter sp. GZD96]|uniref:exo-beta-N-acetylmuramidase NamZ family protein n=1 Tax=Aurantibrevibacter litoralis TaxID=3106030 RepID=UPI002AFE8C6A|nr:DUF1343 domain-containing protein [Arenibacter sp. GZD-96]MEA1785834.1 DUF1343 domain-containing protein [Arenibacter sp. GZD-96]